MAKEEWTCKECGQVNPNSRFKCGGEGCEDTGPDRVMGMAVMDGDDVYDDDGKLIGHAVGETRSVSEEELSSYLDD